MTMQSKKHSFYETVTQNVLGLVIGWCVMYFILPYFGVEANKTQSTIASAIFFVTSFARSFLVRRTFSAIARREYENTKTKNN